MQPIWEPLTADNLVRAKNYAFKQSLETIKGAAYYRWYNRDD